jgi:hypothetical protein
MSLFDEKRHSRFDVETDTIENKIDRAQTRP